MASLKTKIIALILLVSVVGLFMYFYRDLDGLESDYSKYGDAASEIAASEAAPIIPAAINFSHSGYFYTDAFELELSEGRDGIEEIYYTLDGSPPSGEKGELYEESLTLESSSEEINGYTIKACGKLEDGSFTEECVHSYFVGEKVFDRFDTLVFSLTSDPYGLYDYDYGIFVPGRLRDEYIEETGHYNPDPPAPANYNMRGIEAERPVHLEVLDAEGNVLITQNAGMRTFGGWSRAMEQKSIKLYARREYDNIKNTFDYEFFPENSDHYGLGVKEYKRLVLRNSANDSPFAFMRDETTLKCAEKTSLYDTQQTRAAAVFLNGEYYGFAWLHEVYDESYLDYKNRTDNGEWVILEGGENYKTSDEDNPLNPAAIADWDEVYAYAQKDLTDDELFDELSSRVDIENLLTYYAAQIYVDNGDWPRGNYRIYRYFGNPSAIVNDSALVSNVSDMPVNDSQTLSPLTDGKWRFLLYDTDFGLGLYDSQPSKRTLGTLLNENGGENSSPLLIAILKREDMREKFAEIMCDLMAFAYSPQSIADAVKELDAERKNELEHNFELGGAQLSFTWSNMQRVDEEIAKILNFADRRPAEMKKQLEQYLEIEPEGYAINILNGDDARITVGSCDLSLTDESFSGFYYNINNPKLSAEPVLGREFSHWLINGKKYFDREMTLDKSFAEADGEINIELVTHNFMVSEKPYISRISYRTGNDCIELVNPASHEISLEGLYISDDPNDQYKQALPDYRLKAGERLTFYCNNYIQPGAVGSFLLGFNMKAGETVYISDKNKTVLDSAYLYKTTKDVCLERDLNTGGFYETPLQ